MDNFPAIEQSPAGRDVIGKAVDGYRLVAEYRPPRVAGAESEKCPARSDPVNGGDGGDASGGVAVAGYGEHSPHPEGRGALSSQRHRHERIASDERRVDEANASESVFLGVGRVVP